MQLTHNLTIIHCFFGYYFFGNYSEVRVLLLAHILYPELIFFSSLDGKTNYKQLLGAFSWNISCFHLSLSLTLGQVIFYTEYQPYYLLYY